MSEALSRLRSDFPVRFLATLVVALGFATFLVLDQMHWWRLKPDYAFGWLVPAFVAYVIHDRWPRLRNILRENPPHLPPGWMSKVLAIGAGLALAGGLVMFLLGALYRAGAGSTQPGSLMLAAGFSGVLLGMIYFNVPAGRVGAGPAGGFWPALRADPRIRAVGLFVFPALIWTLSAPLVSAVENAISLFLLRRVVTVVFSVFSLLGYPLVQEGNVLLLPQGRVGVADACSGIRSLTACLFAGSFLAAVFVDRVWKKILLVGLAMLFAFLTNLLRSLFLTGWAYAYGSNAIEGSLHDASGYAVLGLTVVGLFLLLPLLSGENWRRWLGVSAPETEAGGSGLPGRAA